MTLSDLLPYTSQPLLAGPVPPMLPKATNNVTATPMSKAALNSPALSSPSDYMNAFGSLAQIGPENALRQAQAQLYGMQGQQAAATVALMQAGMRPPPSMYGGGSASGGTGSPSDAFGSLAPAAPNDSAGASNSGGDGFITGGAVANRIAEEAQRQGVGNRLALTTGAIESRFGADPSTNAAGKTYRGIFQLGPDEWDQMGGGPRDDEQLQIQHGVGLLAQRTQELANRLGRPPADWEVYLAHNQGVSGAASLLNHPDMPAGQAVTLAGGKPANIKSNLGDPNEPSSAFTQAWQARFDRFANRVAAPSNAASGAQGSGEVVPPSAPPTPSAIAPSASPPPNPAAAVSNGAPAPAFGALVPSNGAAPAAGTAVPTGAPGQSISPEYLAWAQQQDQINALLGKRNPINIEEALKLQFARPNALATADLTELNKALIAQRSIAQQYGPNSPQAIAANQAVAKSSGVDAFIGGQRPGVPLQRYNQATGGYEVSPVPGLADAMRNQAIATARPELKDVTNPITGAPEPHWTLPPLPTRGAAQTPAASPGNSVAVTTAMSPQAPAGTGAATDAGPGTQLRGVSPIYLGGVKGMVDSDQERIDKTLQPAADKANDMIARGQLIKDLLPRVATGQWADEKQDLGRFLQGLGVAPDWVKQNITDVAAGDVIQKNFLSQSAEAVRQMGAREPGSVISLFNRAYPRLETQPNAINLMQNIFQMQGQRQQDEFRLAQQQHAGAVNAVSQGQPYEPLSKFTANFAIGSNSAVNYLKAAQAMSDDSVAWQGVRDPATVVSLIPKGTHFVGPDGQPYVKR